MSKFGSTVLNVEYLFVQPAFLRCRQHCKREDDDEEEDEEEEEEEEEEKEEGEENRNVSWMRKGMQEKPMCC